MFGWVRVSQEMLTGQKLGNVAKGRVGEQVQVEGGHVMTYVYFKGNIVQVVGKGRGEAGLDWN